ncbi:hypothetical protein COLO4_05042 [Corchorus olitorius]|uniref:Uncharacterized protein n=1 Tax=Corchorus olitorius TaxID=93759 RepID=A0A1R3KS51_9ROSI|nr:hypothetical protein COLO4_05042 [Corchorus olitorius]
MEARKNCRVQLGETNGIGGVNEWESQRDCEECVKMNAFSPDELASHHPDKSKLAPVLKGEESSRFTTRKMNWT